MQKITTSIMKNLKNSALILGNEISLLLAVFCYLAVVSPLTANLYRPFLLVLGVFFTVLMIWCWRNIIRLLKGEQVSVFRWPKPFGGFPKHLNSNERKLKMLGCTLAGVGGFVGLYSIHEHLTCYFTNIGTAMGAFSSLKIDEPSLNPFFVALGLFVNLILSNYGLRLMKPLFSR